MKAVGYEAPPEDGAVGGHRVVLQESEGKFEVALGVCVYVCIWLFLFFFFSLCCLYYLSVVSFENMTRNRHSTRHT